MGREYGTLYTVASVAIGWLLAARLQSFHGAPFWEQAVDVLIASAAVAGTLWAIVAIIANVRDR